LLQILHDFQVSQGEYLKLSRNNRFPVLESCPNCNAVKVLHRHGFYIRNLVDNEGVKKLYVIRYFCTCCKQTISILPTFLHPRFQYTPGYIQEILETIFMRKKRLGYGQLRFFYKKRFLKNLLRIQSYFRDHDSKLAFPSDTIKKAIKLLEMIRMISTIQSFGQKFWYHFGTAFMAI